jgi:hypothetical protein
LEQIYILARIHFFPHLSKSTLCGYHYAVNLTFCYPTVTPRRSTKKRFEGIHTLHYFLSYSVPVSIPYFDSINKTSLQSLVLPRAL